MPDACFVCCYSYLESLMYISMHTQSCGINDILTLPVSNFPRISLHFQSRNQVEAGCMCVCVCVHVCAYTNGKMFLKIALMVCRWTDCSYLPEEKEISLLHQQRMICRALENFPTIFKLGC